jgi:hypothetical protein
VGSDIKRQWKWKKILYERYKTKCCGVDRERNGRTYRGHRGRNLYGDKRKGPWIHRQLWAVRTGNL